VDKPDPVPVVAIPDVEVVPDAGVPVPPNPLAPLLAMEHSRTLAADREDGGVTGFATSEVPATRARAALAIGRIGEADGVALLLVLLDDEAPSVRAESAFAAAILAGSIKDDEKASKDLRDGVLIAWKKEREARRDPVVREALAWALRRFGGAESEGVVDALFDGLNDGDREVRAAAIESFALVTVYSPKTPGAGRKSFVQGIRQRMGDTDDVTRKAATYALMRMKVKGAAPDFRQALEKRRSDDERIMAIRALSATKNFEIGKMRDLLMPPPEPSLDNLEPVDFRGDVWTQIYAVRHLVAAGNKRAIAVLEDWMREEVFDDLLTHGIGFDAPEFHAVLIVVEGTPNMTKDPRMRALVERLYESSSAGGALRRENASGGESLNAALLHCATAAALDKLDAKLQRVPSCAEGLGSVYPAVRRKILAMETELALAKKAAEKVAVLTRYYSLDAAGGLKVAVMVNAAELADADKKNPRLLRGLGEKALSEKDPVLRSYGVKIAAEGEALVALLGGRADVAPGDEIDVILEALDKVAKLRPEGAEPAVRKWTANPGHAVRARARHVLHELNPKAVPLAYTPAVTEPGGVVGPPIEVVMGTTRGDVTLELLPEVAPATVASFLTLARKGHFQGLSFHRVIAGFVSQGGDPRGDGHGGPGYTIPAEWSRLPYDAGAVGMAHAGKDTGGCQFFITHLDQPHLDGGYTVFGRVTGDGLAVVQRLQAGDTITQVKVR
jgi:cyclophilin family peptidyl-prolyl cis-trans isomerase/HEAT repeat protein